VGAPVLTAIILPCPCFWLKGRHWFRIWLSSKVHPLDYEFLSTSQWLTSFFFLLLAKLWRRKSKFSQLSCTCWHIRDLNSMNLNSLTLIFICFTEGKYNSNCNWIQASRRKWRQAFPGAALSLSLSLSLTHTHTHVPVHFNNMVGCNRNPGKSASTRRSHLWNQSATFHFHWRWFGGDSWVSQEEGSLSLSQSLSYIFSQGMPFWDLKYIYICRY
jgi:hypothetical protein